MAALDTKVHQVSPLSVIKTDEFSDHLRMKAIDVEKEEVLITRYTGSSEERDFSVPSNCEGFGRIHHFRRSQAAGWPANPLPIDPAARALELKSSDILRAQVFQNAVCNWRCWYCFVDFDLLSGDKRYSAFKSCKELVDLWETESDPPRVIDLSGGQPDLVPEWSAWFLKELEKRKARGVYLWSDDNLSNDYLWKYLSASQVRELALSKCYGRVGCFKGFDADSFSFNTRAEPALFARQFQLMKRIVQADFDVYGYVTLTTKSDVKLAEKMADFVDRLQAIHPLFPLRTIPLLITAYTPTQIRLDATKSRALELQWAAVEVWEDMLRTRFDAETRAKQITEHRINEH